MAPWHLPERQSADLGVAQFLQFTDNSFASRLLIVIMKNIELQTVIMQTVVMQNVIVQSVILQNVVAPR